MLKKSENTDIIFESGEELYNYNKSKVLMLEYSTIRIPITRNRKLISYCHEYCGITGVSFNSIKFVSFTGDVNMELILNTNFLVKIYHNTDFHLHSMDPLKESLKNLFISGKNSDILIRINDSLDLPVHKCMLSCRSNKFFAMFDSGMKESVNSIINISCENEEIFKTMIQWLYCGEIKFPKKILHVFELWKLADEYFLSDLKEKCEEGIMLKLDESNVVDIMLKCEEFPNMKDEVKEKCKSLFIHDFDKVKKFNPDFESQIIKVPGLVTSLFEHIHGKKNKQRRVTFVIEQENMNENDNN